MLEDQILGDRTTIVRNGLKSDWTKVRTRPMSELLKSEQAQSESDRRSNFFCPNGTEVQISFVKIRMKLEFLQFHYYGLGQNRVGQVRLGLYQVRLGLSFGQLKLGQGWFVMFCQVRLGLGLQQVSAEHKELPSVEIFMVPEIYR